MDAETGAGKNRCLPDQGRVIQVILNMSLDDHSQPGLRETGKVLIIHSVSRVKGCGVNGNYCARALAITRVS